MKQFDLEKAKAGAEVVTRDGRSARIICWDAKCGDEQIVALVNKNDEEEVYSYCLNGSYVSNRINDLDLFMAPVKKRGFIAIVPNVNADSSYGCTKKVYNSIDKALSSIDDFYKSKAIAIPIEWEE